MLTELLVENLGPIHKAELSLPPGCSVLTGETGAGKTLMVAGLSLLLGERADSGLVREGAEQARVEGRFVIPWDHPSIAALAAQDLIEGEPGHPVEVVVSRTLVAGSAKARINGRLVPARTLAELGRDLVEIAGQHQHQRIGAAPFQRQVLDEFAGPEATALALEVSEAVRTAMQTRARVEELRATVRERARQLDLLEHEIAEIERLAIEPGETESLTTEAWGLEHAEKLAERLGTALVYLHGDGGAEEQVALARAAVSDAASIASELEATTDRLNALGVEIADVANELRDRVVEPDAGRLEEVRARLDAIARLRRKYGDNESDVLEYLQRARDRRDELTGTEENLETLERAGAEAMSRAEKLAARLSELRRAAVGNFVESVEHALHELALPESTFEVTLSPRDLYEGGAETVEFAIATGPGESTRPLTRVASGGELSRIALALHLLTTSATVATMVFDEVDAGVGGAAARSVGQSLARLASRGGMQVLVVTHLPQVAAFADAHYRISKDVRSGRNDALVERVEGESRVEELSRMLAGLPDSDRAREHAQELLELAGEARS